MKINPNEIELLISAVKPEQYPETGLSEVGLSGRSNVGKSSFINSMIGRKNMARTSQQPGKTQTLNFYNIDNQLVFVDVQGYGYAKVSKKQREAFGKMIEKYISQRTSLKLVIQLVDLIHNPTEDDILKYNYLEYFDNTKIVVATKEDRIDKDRGQKILANQKIKLEMEPEEESISYSSIETNKRLQVWDIIAKYI